MADYQLISKISGFSVYNEAELYLDEPPFINGGYTIATPFVLRADLTSGTSPAAVLNGVTFIWNFGDGFETQTTGIQYDSIQSVAHKYNWPGIYEVKLSVASNDGILSKTFSKTLSVTNFLEDSLSWVYTGWTDLSSANLAAGAVFHGYQSCKPGDFNSNLPLTIQFTSSTTLSDRISFDLYSEGSLSQPWGVATYDNRYANLRPRWRFLDLNDSVISSIKPEQDQLVPIYVDALGRTPADIDFNSATQVVVGYTGKVDFYYIDDSPSLYYSFSNYAVKTPRLWVISNTSNYPNYQDKNDKDYNSFSNSTLTLSSLFYVKNLSATHYEITLNGGDIQIPGTLWPSITSRAIITINSSISSSKINSDYANKVLLNYPLAPRVDNTPVRVYVTPNKAATFSDSSFSFFEENSITKSAYGFKKQTFTTLNANSTLLTSTSGVLPVTVTVSATSAVVLLEPPPNALSGYNPNTRVAAANSTNASRIVSLTGSTTFNIIDYDKTYFVRKINEDFNYGAQLQNYALQPTIAVDTNLFLFLSAMAGTSYSTDEQYGTVVYEKISNFVGNNEDIDTSNISNLYSLTKSIDNEFDDFNLNAPPVLKRAIDLYSVSHNRLWGTREKYNLDFNNIDTHNNLGPTLTAYNVDTTIVSAGQKIVLNDKFNSNFYELLEVPVINSYAAVTAANMQTHFTSGASYPLTVYPLSAFFGWGVKTPVKDYYNFWVYNNVYSNTPTSNLIDWNTKTDGLSTTLSESNSSTNEWYKDGGILENIYSYYLYKGLNLLQK
jgi:hypothetical protein